MKKDRDIIQMLKEWLSGDAGYQKERELSDMAQDDPFLADALSGYQSFPEGDHEGRIAQIRERLNKTEKRRLVPPILWRIAAGGAIVIAAVFALRWVNTDPLQPISQEMAETQSIEEESAPADEERKELAEVAEVSSNSEVSDSFEDEASPQAGIARQDTPKELKPKPSTKEAALPPPPPPSIQRAPSSKENNTAKQRTVQPATVARKRSNQGLTEEVAVEADEATPAPASPKFAEEKKERTPEEEARQLLMKDTAIASSIQVVPGRTISGSVTDENGQPLIGAMVQATTTSTGTVTDIEGKFQLPISSDEKEIQFDYTGFSSQRVPLIQNDTYNIQLSNSAVLLDEVVVASDYKAKRRAKKDRALSTMNFKAKRIQLIQVTGVKAAGGQKSLNRIIKQQAKEIAFDPSASGRVVSLRFDVLPDGSINDIKVILSAGSALDAEATRLVKLMKWQLKESHEERRGSVSCQLQF